jgi:thiol:disulfide interchange protein
MEPTESGKSFRPTGASRSGPQTRLPLALLAIVAAAIVFRLVTAVMNRGTDSSGGAGLVRWQPLASAAAQATRSGRPVLYDFTAAWCPPCHLLDAEAWNDTGIASRVDTLFVPARIMDRQREDGRNTPDVEELQRRYRVTAFPTLVVADASGREIARMEGYGGRQRLEAFLAEAVAKTRK